MGHRQWVTESGEGNIMDNLKFKKYGGATEAGGVIGAVGSGMIVAVRLGVVEGREVFSDRKMKTYGGNCGCVTGSKRLGMGHARRRVCGGKGQCGGIAREFQTMGFTVR